MRKSRKLLKIVKKPRWLIAAMRYRVAAAVEHIPVIRATEAATLIDIGANKGQFSLAFRAIRPKAQIIAFEPLPSEAQTFERVFEDDRAVALHRLALSDREGEATFHVTNRPDSSSLLSPADGQTVAFGVTSTKTIIVPLRRFDEVIPTDELEKPVLVKIDVQGAELQALAGMRDLSWCDHIYVELSFVELYTGQPLLSEMIGYLRERGFEPSGFFNQVSTARFGPTQVDVLFARRD